MKYRNEWELIGCLGSDPEIVALPSQNGAIAVNISLATNKPCMKNGKPTFHTDWHTISMYGRHANYAAKALKKGTEVLISGKVRTKEIVIQSGAKIRVSELVVNERNHCIMILSSMEKRKERSSESQPIPAEPFPYSNIREEGLDTTPSNHFPDNMGYAPPPSSESEQY